MKIIISDGGPLVGLDSDFVNHWSGIWGKHFIGNAAPFSNDYEATGYSSDGRRKPPCNISKLSGIVADALLISMPFETAAIASSAASVCMAQVEYSDPDWTFSLIDPNIFSEENFNTDETIGFSAKKCNFRFFDAACSADQIRDDFISFNLEAGEYKFSSAHYNPNERTGLILYKITKVR